MYLFLGGDVSVWENDVIGIFDMDNTTVAKSTRGFLSRAQREGAVINVTADLPRSFCVASEGGKEKVYISQLSPATLKKRGGGI
ncbi:MAG: extracellular matrix regulator RemB [Oscillospiraceae bacterium]